MVSLLEQILSYCIRFKIRGGSPWDLKNIPSPGPCFLSALRVAKRENPRPLELTRRNHITNLRERLTLLQWLPHAWFLSSFSGRCMILMDMFMETNLV